MSDQLWSWLLGAVGLIGFWLAGRKVWWCWYINIANQILWVAYSLVTKQYGFLVAAFGYSFVFTKNAYTWTKEYKKKDTWTTNVEEKVIYSPNTPIGSIDDVMLMKHLCRDENDLRGLLLTKDVLEYLPPLHHGYKAVGETPDPLPDPPQGPGGGSR